MKLVKEAVNILREMLQKCIDERMLQVLMISREASLKYKKLEGFLGQS